MSVEGHDQAAAREAKLADAHAAKFDPDAWSAGTGGCSSYCFSTWANPTSDHASKAQEHRRLAGQHRRASQALQDAEASACESIPPRDRDLSPFFHVDDITSVQTEPSADDSGGFAIRFAAIHGVDDNAMQQLIDCHIARSASRGHVAPELEYCPLAPAGVSAKVGGLEDGGLEVRLIARDSQAEDELRARLRELDAHVKEAAELRAAGSLSPAAAVAGPG